MIELEGLARLLLLALRERVIVIWLNAYFRVQVLTVSHNVCPKL